LCVFICSRLAYNKPVDWAEARRNCQQEGATLAIVNSEEEADILSFLYLKYGPYRVQQGSRASETSEGENPPLEPATELTNATVLIGIHDIFIEGEYLTVHSK
jgi:hypothetical protein